MPVADLSGKLAIVTGANSGIGLEAARAFAGIGARVVLACRNKERGEEAKKSIVESTGNLEIEVEILDCASLSSVRDFLSRWKKKESKRVDILVNNAGATTAALIITEDGYEQTYQANHLSHVLLTHGLLNAGCIAPMDALFDNKAGAKLSFIDMMRLYNRSKAAQVVWSMALQRRLSATEGWKGITVHSCHPGRTFGISTVEGAATVVWLAVASEPVLTGMEGLFWDRMKWKWIEPWSLNVGLQNELWDVWCKDTDTPLL
ncbi:Enoyl-(Acyl carrier protein) reductase [Rhizoctonia solani]|uniref:Enoyl-(Acyl carrier protein) reductase n=1 Tax=Rhizoctonia solani TaxID=456999 RepID=A0A8H7M778_9AGAM|nr:Enoyl-(Acyl carrier protein) reductase [Rhizoctonia solani]